MEWNFTMPNDGEVDQKQERQTTNGYQIGWKWKWGIGAGRAQTVQTVQLTFILGKAALFKKGFSDNWNMEIYRSFSRQIKVTS